MMRITKFEQRKLMFKLNIINLMLGVSFKMYIVAVCALDDNALFSGLF